jgi:hypothetical protein
MVELRMAIWVGYVARVGEKRNACRVLVRNPEGKRPLETLGTGGRIILNWMLQKQHGVVWSGWI